MESLLSWQQHNYYLFTLMRQNITLQSFKLISVQLTLGVRAQDRDHMCHCQLVKLKPAKFVQLQLDVQEHLDRVGWRQHRHPVLPSRGWK